MRDKNMQFGPYLWPNSQNSCIIYEIGVGALRMRNEKYAFWPLVMLHSSAMDL